LSPPAATRRGNWLAFSVGSVLIVVAYFIYGRATATPGHMDMRGAATALALSPVAFLSMALLSRRESPWKRAAQATAVLVLVGAPVGLLAPIIGASAGYGFGTAITLNAPPFDHVHRNRIIGVAAVVAYSFLLLLVLPPAVVLSGALSPPLAVGIADEYSAWRAGGSKATTNPAG